MERPSLHDTSFKASVEDFFRDIQRRMSRYVYVSAAERRCFNLAWYYHDDKDQSDQLFMSNYGLLHCHRYLTNFYVRYGYFPPIMLLDDIMVHGRGMSKFLFQLETLIEEDLQRKVDRGESLASDIRDFRHRLIQAVDIFVFARSDMPLLMDEPYCRKLHYKKMLTKQQIHDLSMQISDYLHEKNIANTSFVYSACCLPIYAQLIQNNQIQDLNTLTRSPSQWKQIHWSYKDEPMELFLNFGNSPRREVKRISSIRYFPARAAAGQKGRFISFTMVGTIENQALLNFGQRFAKLLQEDSNKNGNTYCYHYFRSLLTDIPTGRSYALGQIFYYFLSAVDYRNFLKQHQQSVPSITNSMDKLGDVDKICRNFGPYRKTFPEFARILSSDELMDQIEMLLESTLESSMVQPLFIRSEQYDSLSCSEFEQNTVNRIVESFFYDRGIEAEENAIQWLQNETSFHIGNFQELDHAQSTQEYDGICSLQEIHKKLIEQSIGSTSAVQNDYYRTAALIAVMDYGRMSVRLQSSARGELAISKVGELATFYLPEQLSIALPAYAYLEQFSRRIDMSPAEAVTTFNDWLTPERILKVLELPNRNTFQKQLEQIIAHLRHTTPRFLAAAKVTQQTFREWNFTNLIYQPTPEGRVYQWAIQELALDFLQIDPTKG